MPGKVLLGHICECHDLAYYLIYFEQSFKSCSHFLVYELTVLFIIAAYKIRHRPLFCSEIWITQQQKNRKDAVTWS